MRSKNSADRSNDQDQPTFITSARRAQIVAAAIDTIAELGYGLASLARIAERAGTSKGVLTYHFAGKQDLIQAVIAEVLRRGGEYMRPRIEAESTGAGALRAYIEANLAFMDEHRNHMIAIIEIYRGTRRRDGSLPFDSAPIDASTAYLEQFLRAFQERGEFRGFDPRVMAYAIRSAIDAIPQQLAKGFELDLEHYGAELADLYVHAVRLD